MTSPKYSVIIPCFNEEGNIKTILQSLKGVLKEDQYEIIFIDDGSTDGTLERLREARALDSRIKFLSFSRNFGHQRALKAGIDNASGDCIIMLDADLQHPISIISELINKWKEGYEIVVTSRLPDPDLSFMKRITSDGFYWIMRKLSRLDISAGEADFRLVDRKVADVIKKINDDRIFFRGLISWLGYRRYKIEYVPGKRVSGVSKYSLLRMIGFALNGITSFSVFPLRLSSYFGAGIFMFSMAYLIYAVAVNLFTNKTLPGWTSLLVCVLFLGGVQLLMLGVIGEYLGRLFIGMKGRPLYIIREGGGIESKN